MIKQCFEGALLKVNRTQLYNIGSAPDQGFRGALRARICHDFAAQPHNLPQSESERRADALWMQASTYGMRSQSDYTRYSYLMMGYWDHWAESPDRPWISQVLLSTEMTGAAKMDYVYKVLEGKA